MQSAYSRAQAERTENYWVTLVFYKFIYLSDNPYIEVYFIDLTITI